MCTPDLLHRSTDSSNGGKLLARRRAGTYRHIIPYSMIDYTIVSALHILNLRGIASAQLGVMRPLLVFPASEYGILRFHHSDFAAKVWSIRKAMPAAYAVSTPPPSAAGFASVLACRAPNQSQRLPCCST